MEKKAKQIQAEMDKLAETRLPSEQHVKEQQMELVAQKKEFELEQKFAQREMQMEFDHATRQLDQSAKAHLDQIQNAHGMAQEQLSLREAAAKDAEGRAQASAQGRRRPSTIGHQGQAAGSRQRRFGLVPAANATCADSPSHAGKRGCPTQSTSTPRVAKKQPDGSWRAAHEGS